MKGCDNTMRIIDASFVVTLRLFKSSIRYSSFLYSGDLTLKAAAALLLDSEGLIICCLSADDSVLTVPSSFFLGTGPGKIIIAPTIVMKSQLPTRTLHISMNLSLTD